MEFLTIILTSLLTLLSPVGLLAERQAENAIRTRLQKVEQLKIRIDNTPSYQILQGKVTHFRMASQGLWVNKDVRIDALELETDPLDLNLQRLRQGNQKSGGFLNSPVQAGVRLVLTEVDTNQALKSPQVVARLQQVINRVLPAAQSYDVINPSVKFLANNRLRFQVELQKRGSTEQMAVMVESGIAVVAGRSFQLIQPAVSINGKPLSPGLVKLLTAGISSADLRKLESAGIVARILQLKVDSSRLELATFVRFSSTQGATLQYQKFLPNLDNS